MKFSEYQELLPLEIQETVQNIHAELSAMGFTEEIKENGTDRFKLTFNEIERIAGLSIDHSFLNCKKELLDYGYKVGKISLKEKTVGFEKMQGEY